MPSFGCDWITACLLYTAHRPLPASTKPSKAHHHSSLIHLLTTQHFPPARTRWPSSPWPLARIRPRLGAAGRGEDLAAQMNLLAAERRKRGAVEGLEVVKGAAAGVWRPDAAPVRKVA